MKTFHKAAFLSFCLIPAGLLAQEASDAGGIQWGRVSIRPEASVLEAYDNRIFNETGGSDFYTETAAAVSFENLPARYDLAAQAGYGYRFYSENTELNDDFYNGKASVSSDQNPLKWGLSSDLEKTLNYNNHYDPATGQGPGSILTNQPNQRVVSRGHIAYEKQVTDKTAIEPGYGVLHYYQDFQGGGTAEWQEHDASIQIRYRNSAKTLLTAEGMYSLQVNDDENGYISTVTVGIENNMTDTLSWRASVGVAAADYEVSGSDQSGIASLRLRYQPNEAISAYVFGKNDYQPGYGGGTARRVYRAGYGADWRLASRVSIGGQVLHDYEQELGSGKATSYGGVRHFFTAQCGYDITRKLLLSLSGSFVNDEYEQNQTVVALNLGYRY
ncbi:MAG: hypothetical protein K9L89_03375 [Kiritimatiellales bacterium]|nr:hypothetical protein [Kiritimatiellales bacterium]